MPYNTTNFPVSWGQVMMIVLFIVLLIFLTSCSEAKKAVQNLLEIDPEPKPDLIITETSVTKTNPNGGERFTLSFDVQNQGRGPSGRFLFYPKMSTAPSITLATPQVTAGDGTGIQLIFAGISNLGPSETVTRSVEVVAPSTPGTYYYGACADPVTGESDTTNNCSGDKPAMVRVGLPLTEPSTIPTPSPRSSYGAFAVGRTDTSYGWVLRYGESASEARNNAETACRSLSNAISSCRSVAIFPCGALAVGARPRPAWGVASGSTMSEAQTAAIVQCRNAGGTNCRIATGSSGRAASVCLNR